jgi:hypothetical protein
VLETHERNLWDGNNIVLYLGRPKMSLTFSKVSKSPVFYTRVNRFSPEYKIETYLGQVITDLDAWTSVDGRHFDDNVERLALLFAST